MLEPIEKRWFIKEPVPYQVEDELRDFHPIIRQLLFNRKITSAHQANDYFNHNIPVKDRDPFLFKGMNKAVDLIKYAIEKNETIAVYGDYDVDGITATALLSQVLITLGAQVIPYIPNRFEEGYGVNLEAMSFLRESDVNLLITVDCGIRSPQELGFAKSIGMNVIITDHHAPGELIPNVDCVICQHQPGDTYPDKNLSGVGLAYKLAQALFGIDSLGNSEADQWLDLAALGTVADVVPLLGENRMIVKRGLALMRTGSRLGLRFLINAAGLRIDKLSSTDISFGIAPRLNAAGRLESPEKALEILMTKDQHRAATLAQELDDLNRKRQDLTKENQELADLNVKPDDLILFVASEKFHSGLVGLVAAKLTEFYYRPTIIGYSENGYTRASCRSIPEFHITQALDECEDLLIQHGGHAMAAGFTVPNTNLEELIRRLKSIAEKKFVIPPQPVLTADMELSLNHIPPNILKELDLLEPFGAENPQPVFISRNVEVIKHRAVGREQNHLKLSLRDGKNVFFDAIAFKLGYWTKALPGKVDIIYSIEHNYFNNNEYTQLNIKDIQANKC